MDTETALDLLVSIGMAEITLGRRLTRAERAKIAKGTKKP